MITQVLQVIQAQAHQAMTAVQAVIQEARTQAAINKEKKMLTEQELQSNLINEMMKETALQTKVRSMFNLQNKLNSLINPEWYKQDHWDFQRATMVELNELLDHYGYKWWKAQTPNVEQCQLEVIDIAHFHISHLMQAAYRGGQTDHDYYAADFAEFIQPVEVDKSPEGIRKLIDECVFLASSKNFSSAALGMLMSAFDITPDELCNKYILKNTLNVFRTSNGYKEGTYKKIWNGKEDNEVLMEVFTEVDADSASLAEDLYTKLEEAYKAA